MAEFDHGVKYISRKVGRDLARLAHLECRSWRPVESTLQSTTERLSDRAFVARGRQDHLVVYFDFFASWNLAALWNLLAKSGLLSERERLPTVCVPVVLRMPGNDRKHRIRSHATRLAPLRFDKNSFPIYHLAAQVLAPRASETYASLARRANRTRSVNWNCVPTPGGGNEEK